MCVHEYASIWVRFLGEIAKCMVGSGKDKMRLEHLAMPESKEALKKKSMSQGHKYHLNRLPLAKCGTVWSVK